MYLILHLFPQPALKMTFMSVPICIHQSVFTESVKSWFLNKMRCWVTSYRIRKHFYFSLNSSKGFQLNKCKCLLNYWWHNVVSIFIICGIYSIAWKQILDFVRLQNALYSHVICWLARRFLTVGLETSSQFLVTKDRVKSMTFSFSKYIKMQGQG